MLAKMLIQLVMHPPHLPFGYWGGWLASKNWEASGHSFKWVVPARFVHTWHLYVLNEGDSVGASLAPNLVLVTSSERRGCSLAILFCTVVLILSPGQFHRIELGACISIPWQLCSGLSQFALWSPIRFNFCMKPLAGVISRFGARCC